MSAGVNDELFPDSLLPGPTERAVSSIKGTFSLFPIARSLVVVAYSRCERAHLFFFFFSFRKDEDVVVR